MTKKELFEDVAKFVATWGTRDSHGKNGLDHEAILYLLKKVNER